MHVRATAASKLNTGCPVPATAPTVTSSTQDMAARTPRQAQSPMSTMTMTMCCTPHLPQSQLAVCSPTPEAQPAHCHRAPPRSCGVFSCMPMHTAGIEAVHRLPRPCHSPHGHLEYPAGRSHCRPRHHTMSTRSKTMCCTPRLQQPQCCVLAHSEAQPAHCHRSVPARAECSAACPMHTAASKLNTGSPVPATAPTVTSEYPAMAVPLHPLGTSPMSTMTKPMCCTPPSPQSHSLCARPLRSSARSLSQSSLPLDAECSAACRCTPQASKLYTDCPVPATAPTVTLDVPSCPLALPDTAAHTRRRAPRRRAASPACNKPRCCVLAHSRSSARSLSQSSPRSMRLFSIAMHDHRCIEAVHRQPRPCHSPHGHLEYPACSRCTA